MSAGQAFVWMDRYLDTTDRGPMFLRQPEVASAVLASLHKGVELGHYELAAWVIMANHVHILLFPKIAPPRLLGALKGTSAREANRILGRTGEPFWQHESYDRWVRDDAERARIVAYIENNPVKSGICGRAEDYLWSSAGARATSAGTSPGAASTSARAT